MVLIPAVGAALTWEAATRILRGKHASWRRRNYAQREVDLAGGVAVAAATVSAGILASKSGYRGQSLILATAALVGAYDDGIVALPHGLVAETTAKGLRGHLRAARNGEITTGLLKLVAIPTVTFIVASANEYSRSRHAASGRARLLQAGLKAGTATIAISGCANLANLFDLRPGRALKTSVFGAAASAVAAVRKGNNAQLANAAITISTLALPSDLREKTMLGDTGANPLGALVGLAVVSCGGITVPLVAATTSALILVSERVSFTQVIAQTPFLNWIDRLGTLQS